MRVYLTRTMAYDGSDGVAHGIRVSIPTFRMQPRVGFVLHSSPIVSTAILTCVQVVRLLLWLVKSGPSDRLG